jgi:hypothetical protein
MTSCLLVCLSRWALCDGVNLGDCSVSGWGLFDALFAWLTSHAAHCPASWSKMVFTSLCSTWHAPIMVDSAVSLAGWYLHYNLIMPQLTVYAVEVRSVWVSVVFSIWFNFFLPCFLANGCTFWPQHLCKLLRGVGFQKCLHDLPQNSRNWKYFLRWWSKPWVCYDRRSVQPFDPRGPMICGHFCKWIRCFTVAFGLMEYELQDNFSSQTCCMFTTRLLRMHMCAGWTLWIYLIQSAQVHSTRQAVCHSCLESRCGEVSHHCMSLRNSSPIGNLCSHAK